LSVRWLYGPSAGLIRPALLNNCNLWHFTQINIWKSINLPHTQGHSLHLFLLQRLSPWSWASVFGFWCIANCFLLALCVLCSGLLLYVDFNNYFKLSQFKKLWWKRVRGVEGINAVHRRQGAFKINFFLMLFHFSIIAFWLFSNIYVWRIFCISIAVFWWPAYAHMYVYMDA